MRQGMRSRRFFHKKSSKNCPPGGGFLIPPPEGAAEGVAVFDQTFVKSLRVRNALREGLQFLVAKMDGVIVTVVHDEFRGMGLSGVSGILGGAVVVDAGEVKGKGFYYKGL